MNSSCEITLFNKIRPAQVEFTRSGWRQFFKLNRRAVRSSVSTNCTLQRVRLAFAQLSAWTVVWCRAKV